MLAYLVIREGSKWTDVFRLVPGQPVTVGRAPTNQIVVKDERCSRTHAEIFFSQERWVLRDLESRNGTVVGSQPIKGDYVLNPDDVIRVGHTQMAFVHDLATAFPDSMGGGDAAAAGKIDETVPLASVSDSNVLSVEEPTKITHRRVQTRFLSPPPAEEEASAPKVGRAAAQLCRLAFEMAKAPDLQSVSRVALAGLFDATEMDAGAILLLPRFFKGEPTAGDLEVVASRTDSPLNYQRVSNFVANTVLREKEAVLARNVMGDSALSIRDSKGEFHATSLICAPIRKNERRLGVVHLYSTRPERVPDPDDLELTLAVADTLAVALENLSRRLELSENLTQIRDENLQLRERLGVESEIIGTSAAMDNVQHEISRAAPNRSTVLIRGESGVGKELVARAIHFSSPRKKGPFCVINCAALSESLLESELFGHERGAFTGATERKIGKFEAADTGTLMLDEIGEMSPHIQAKFLRVLEGHPFERVGGSEPIKVDVRVIAATNRDLERAVADNSFRRDLFFRLHVLEMFVPALRKHPEDIPELAKHFLQKFNAETGRKLRGFTAEAIDHLYQYRWPGNVRELKNVVERAVVLAQEEYIDVDDLTLSKISTAGDTGEIMPPAVNSFEPMSLEELERRHILATLNSTGWNKSQTARILGIERSTLDRKIDRYQLDVYLPPRGRTAKP